MRINKLNLYYFQAYIKEFFKFHERLTVIIGDSDAGKSSIIRALSYIITNRPTRNNYPNNQQEEEKFKIAITDGNNIVIRSRLNGDNIYSLNGRKNKAFRTDVPADIANCLNLSEVNIQQQKDHFFLINDTPGQVSKKLNKVSGLSEIDRSTKGLKTDIKEINGELLHLDKDLKGLEGEIVSLAWVAPAMKSLEELEQLQEMIDKENTEKAYLISTINSITLLQKDLDEILPKTFGTDVDHLLSLYSSIKSEIKERDNLNAHVLRLQILKTKLNTSTSIDLTELNKYRKSILKDEDELTEIIEAIDLWELRKSELVILDNQIKSTQKDLQEFKVCPTCKKII